MKIVPLLLLLASAVFLLVAILLNRLGVVEQMANAAPLRIDLSQLKTQMDEETFGLLSQGSYLLTKEAALSEPQLSQNLVGACGRTLAADEANGSRRLCGGSLLEVTAEEGRLVPPIVHFTLLYDLPTDLQFSQMVSILSAFWILRPRYVILWTSAPLTGEYWEHLKKNVSSGTEVLEDRRAVVVMTVQQPEGVYGHTDVSIKQHRADILRVEALYSFGGVYLDSDVIVVRPFEPLYRHEFTIGRESPAGLCNSVLLSARGGRMIAKWHQFYRFYSPSYNLISVRLPHALNLFFNANQQLAAAADNVSIMHVEEESMNRPNWSDEELPWIYGPERRWNWRRRNVCVHLWMRRHVRQSGRRPEWSSLETDDSMFGDLLRFVMLGKAPLERPDVAS